MKSGITSRRRLGSALSARTNTYYIIYICTAHLVTRQAPPALCACPANFNCCLRGTPRNIARPYPERTPSIIPCRQTTHGATTFWPGGQGEGRGEVRRGAGEQAECVLLGCGAVHGRRRGMLTPSIPVQTLVLRVRAWNGLLFSLSRRHERHSRRDTSGRRPEPH